VRRRIIRCGVCGILWGLCGTVGFGQEVNSLLLRIKAVGKEGAGNVEAAKAWKELVQKGPDVLPVVLEGFDDASPAATNWLRGAVEAIQDRAMRRGQPLPVAKLEAFVRDTRHSGPARRLAYECLGRLDPTTPKRLLPGMLNDPSSELRRDAVAVKLHDAATTTFDTPLARKRYFKDLLQNARDRDQVQTISDELNKLGEKIDLTSHYGFVTRWLVLGPFDNSKRAGFQNVYPPEKAIEVNAQFAGKDGKLIRWQELNTSKPLGLVDFNEAIGKLRDTVGYGYTVLTSDAERPVDVRVGSNNAVRIWLNGKEIYFREEYHHGMAMDQHIGRGVLQMGRNEILIKVCQNEQTEAWAQQWSFQLRVCDALGAAVPVGNVTQKAK
jgi:hypothetical protein